MVTIDKDIIWMYGNKRRTHMSWRMFVVGFVSIMLAFGGFAANVYGAWVKDVTGPLLIMVVAILSLVGPLKYEKRLAFSAGGGLAAVLVFGLMVGWEFFLR